MLGAGTAHGEPPEQLWSELGPLGKTTQYMTRSKRDAALEAKLAHCHARRDLQLPGTLVRMRRQASARVEEACRRISDLLAQLDARGRDRTQVSGRVWRSGGYGAGAEEYARHQQARWAGLTNGGEPWVRLAYSHGLCGMPCSPCHFQNPHLWLVVHAQVAGLLRAAAAATANASSSAPKVALRVQYVELRTKLELANEREGREGREGAVGPSVALVLAGKDAQSLVVGTQGYAQLEARCRRLEQQLTECERVPLHSPAYAVMVGQYFEHTVSPTHITAWDRLCKTRRASVHPHLRPADP
jgi:hypothetical protein